MYSNIHALSCFYDLAVSSSAVFLFHVAAFMSGEGGGKSWPPRATEMGLQLISTQIKGKERIIRGCCSTSNPSYLEALLLIVMLTQLPLYDTMSGSVVTKPTTHTVQQ